MSRHTVGLALAILMLGGCGPKNGGKTSADGSDPWAEETRAELEKECTETDTSSCFLIGLMLYEGEGLVQDKAEARGYFEMSCDGGDPMGCFILGAMLADGEGGEKDLAGAREMFGRACEDGDAGGCHLLGLMHLQGEGGPVDTEKALDLFDRACTAGDGRACLLLGDMSDDTDDAGSLEMARSWYKAGCQGGEAECCYRLGMMYAEGRGGEPDAELASFLVTKACEMGYAAACDALSP